MGLNQSTHGTWNTNALCNLHLATGAICRTGSGPFSLTGQPNAMGGREMGYMGPGLPGQRSVLVDADRRVRRGPVGPPAGHAAHRRRGTGTVDLFARMAAGDDQGLLDHLHQPGRVGRQPQHRHRRAWRRPSSSSPRTSFADTETNAYADVVLPGAMWAEARRRHGQLRAQPHARARRRSTRPARPWPTGSSSPRSPARWASPTASTTPAPRRSSTSSARFANPATGYDLRGVTLRPAARGARAVAGRAADGPAATRSATSTRRTAALAFPDGRAGGRVFHARPHLTAAELPDDDHPFVLNTGRAPAPVAHADQDRQGRQAQRSSTPDRSSRSTRPTRGALGIARRRPGRGRLAARPRRAAGGRHRPGAAGQLLRAVPLERPVRRVPQRQRGHQRRRRPGLVPARAQGLRGVAEPRRRWRPGEVCRRKVGGIRAPAGGSCPRRLRESDRPHRHRAADPGA